MGLKTIKKVYICSRYRADERHTVESNIARALFACTYALRHDCAPFAPHLIYPRCLDDADPDDRKTGRLAGMAFLADCDEVWQWGATISEGMESELKMARILGVPIKVFNSIGIPQERWNTGDSKCSV